MMILTLAIVQEMFAQCHLKQCKIIFFIVPIPLFFIVPIPLKRFLFCFWVRSFYTSIKWTEVIKQLPSSVPNNYRRHSFQVKWNMCQNRSNTLPVPSIAGEILFPLPTFCSLASICLPWPDWKQPEGEKPYELCNFSDFA